MHHLLFYPLLENQITIVFWLNLNVTMHTLKWNRELSQNRIYLNKF